MKTPERTVEMRGWRNRILDCGGKLAPWGNDPSHHGLLAKQIPHGASATPLWEDPDPVEKRRRRCALPAQSKTWLALLVLLSALELQLSSARAQSFSIDWHTIDGGGGTSTGGVYAVSGTIGQPDAGRMTGGIYSIHGGFWGVIAAVQTPGAPLLTIFRTPTNTVAVSWPSPSTGWTLQHNTNSISSVNWSNAPGTILDDGTTKTLIVNPPTGNRFYRLFKP